MQIRRLTSTGLLTLCALCGALGLASSPASAEIGHKYLSRITEVPANPAKPSLVSGPLQSPEGLAVDSGNLYVLDNREGNKVLDEFNSSSEFLKQVPGVGGFSLAVNHATGEVYASFGEVNVFSAAGEHLATWRGEDTPSKSFGDREGSVAMDNSTNPSDPAAGDVYVSDGGDRVVDVFKPEPGGKEKYLTQLTGAGTPGGSFAFPRDISVDTATGNLLVVDQREPVSAVDVFSPKAAGGYEFLFQLTGPPGAGFGRIEYVATNSSDGDIYVTAQVTGQDHYFVYEFTSSGSYLGHLTGTPSGFFGEGLGVAIGATGDVYIADARAKVVDVFGPNVTVPAVSTGASSNLRGRGATLNGTVDPSGVPITVCQFEYGTTLSYGATVPCSPATPEGANPVPVAANLAELTPGTTYHYRLVATDAEGVTVSGADETFTMPLPEAVAAAPSNVQSARATLNGTVANPQEVPIATCQFEYGISSFEEFTVPCSPAPGSAAGPVPVGAGIVGLAFDTIYRYRLALTPSGGPTVYSVEKTLYTPPVVAGSAFASGITSFAATLTGVLESREITPTYHFVYGLTGAYGSSMPQPDAQAGVGGQQTVSQALTGLQPGTTYHFALVANNFGGIEVMGPDETFTTRPLVPPAVSTGAAEAIGQTTATLMGSVDAEGLPTTYRFEYGLTSGYGSSWPLVQVFAGSGSASQGVAVGVPNLQPGATYHYRLVATNEDGTTYGADQAFATPSYPVSVVQETPVLTTKLGFVYPEPSRSSGKASNPKGGKGKKRGRRRARGRRKGGRKG